MVWQDSASANIVTYQYMNQYASRKAQFEKSIAAATQAINGQFPRPWMTDLADPLSAEVFIVGRNPARTYDASKVSVQPTHL